MYEWNPLGSSIYWDKDKLTCSFLMTKQANLETDQQ